jgi:acyl-coenzyme A thioesterase PaaI-like protein
MEREPGQLIGRGHPAGDFLEAYDWKVLLEEPGKLHLDVHVAPAARNPLGQVFGGFAPTYVDLVALFTVRASLPRDDDSLKEILATANMRVDFMEPLVGPRFRIESERVKQRGRNHWVQTRFLQNDELALFALTTLRAIPRSREAGP